MGEVTRYDCTCEIWMDPFSHGDWVSFEDYEKLEAQVAKLREVVEIVRELVGDYTITDKRLIKALEATK